MTENEKKLIETMANVFQAQAEKCHGTAKANHDLEYAASFWTCGIVLQNMALDLRKQIFEESSCNPPKKDQ